MSFKILQKNLLKSKVLDLSYMQKQLDMKNQFLDQFDLQSDKEVPKRLRESLTSETTRKFQEELTAVVCAMKEDPGDHLGGNVNEASRDENDEECSSNCSYNNCLVQEPTHHSEISISPLVNQKSDSSVDLVRCQSSLMTNQTADRNCSSPLKFTRLVWLRNNSVIIHWSAETYFGIRGYQV